MAVADFGYRIPAAALSAAAAEVSASSFLIS